MTQHSSDATKSFRDGLWQYDLGTIQDAIAAKTLVDKLQAYCAKHYNELMNAWADIDVPVKPSAAATLLYAMIALGGSGDVASALKRLNEAER